METFIDIIIFIAALLLTIGMFAPFIELGESMNILARMKHIGERLDQENKYQQSQQNERQSQEIKKLRANQLNILLANNVGDVPTDAFLVDIMKEIPMQELKTLKRGIETNWVTYNGVNCWEKSMALYEKMKNAIIDNLFSDADHRGLNKAQIFTLKYYSNKIPDNIREMILFKIEEKFYI